VEGQFTVKASRLYDSVSNKIIDDGAVVVCGDRVVYAGAASGLPSIQGDELSFENHTLLPGLIDAHVHLTMDGGADPVLDLTRDSLPKASFRAVRNAEKLINAGITTVRDCGSQGYVSVELSEAERSGLIKKTPRIVACGPPICITGGHGNFIGMCCDGPDEVRKAARTIIKNGAKFLKLISTGGVITPGSTMGATQLDPPEVAAAVAEAKKLGLKTAAHAHGTEGIKIALKAGVNTIEHASYVDEESIELFLQTGAVFVSTLIASQRQIEHIHEIPAFIGPKIIVHIEKEKESIEKLIEAGVTAVAGTDAGTPYNPHGELYLQLITLSKLGLGNLGALKAGTIDAATALNMESDVGSLTTGKKADFIVVKGSPEKDLATLKEVCSVWKNGIRIC